jgi:vacuolar-type H+-ATPase subunit H
MTTTDMQKDTAASVADHTEASAEPQVDTGDEARQLMAKARFDAFQLVTEARKEAESILDEARQEAAEIVTAAKMQAESIVDAAHIGADEVRASHDADPPSSDPAADGEPEGALVAEHDQLVERVTSLRAVADQLEERFAALAATAQNQARPNPDASTAPILDYSPSVPAPKPEAVVDEEPPADRGSFYNRRSAKLPSIGDAGGRSALDMMRTIRGAFDEKS